MPTLDNAQRFSGLDPRGLAGVRRFELQRHADNRGDLTILFAESSDPCPATGSPPPHLPQWNLIRSGANVLRGMHAHLDFDEYYISIQGDLLIWLFDARGQSPTFGRAQRLLCDAPSVAVLVPRGVVHGVYCATPSILGYGLTRTYTGNGEFECRFDDPALGIEWPTSAPAMSSRDRNAGELSVIMEAFADVGA